MCGIAGIFNFKNKHVPERAQVESMLRELAHRGPDHQGLFFEDALCMGNVRLAIQGVDQSGNQPVYNEDRSVVVVYNGEIYNHHTLRERLIEKGHVFATRTDTELLVHLYEDEGSNFCASLNGMFAFALYDRRRNRLLLARDRTAQKPLYINWNSRGIAFASELKALLGVLDSRRVNRNAVLNFLQMSYCPEPMTLVEGVEVVEPGQWISIEEQTVKQGNFLEEGAELSSLSSEEVWLEEAFNIFPAAVNRHLISDVPVTVFLSGGIDSSLIACALASMDRVKTCFTASFTDNPDHDEFPYAQKLARACGFDIERVELSRSILANNIEPFLASSSMPQGDYSGLATYLLAKQTARSFRVVLGGDGGDELFGGYPTYLYPRLLQKYGWIPAAAMRFGQFAAYLLSDRRRYMSRHFKFQQLAQAWGRPHVEAHFHVKRFLPDGLAAELFKEDTGASVSDAVLLRYQRAYAESEREDAESRLQEIDFNFFLRSCTIPKAERNCMAVSLENRLPMLDNEMLALARRTPASLCIKGMDTKVCLRKLLARMLPSNVPLNPIKQGFSPPLRQMLDEELRQWRADCLTMDTPILSRDTLSPLDRWNRKGWDLHRLEWSVCVLKDWISRHQLN